MGRLRARFRIPVLHDSTDMTNRLVPEYWSRKRARIAIAILLFAPSRHQTAPFGSRAAHAIRPGRVPGIAHSDAAPDTVTEVAGDGHLDLVALGVGPPFLAR